MASTASWVVSGVGFAGATKAMFVHPVGWAVAATALWMNVVDHRMESKHDEVQKENGRALTLIPGNMHDALKFVGQRGGMAFEADATSPWLWCEVASFRPKAWRVAFRSTSQKPDGTWDYRIDHPWKH